MELREVTVAIEPTQTVNTCILNSDG
ncbi:uncharacterized protein G2W53_021359 [Senna tora]|uniref:Uncharacterized protein n=1 Tax=Senna tora TaxID=362788 RepID=A0A834TK19_9FABA|nr:uncharacterized protein G2W53_021359 [Senna tora]